MSLGDNYDKGTTSEILRTQFFIYLFKGIFFLKIWLGEGMPKNFE